MACGGSKEILAFPQIAWRYDSYAKQSSWAAAIHTVIHAVIQAVIRGWKLESGGWSVCCDLKYWKDRVSDYVLRTAVL
jgi:hypothetical protein